MKFIPISENEVDQEKLKAEYEQSQKVGKVGLGESIFFFKNKFKICYIPIQNIYRAFRRVKCVPVKICCGKGELQLEYIVVCSNKSELAEVDLPNENSVNFLLEEFQKKNKKIKIGKKQ